VAVSRADRRRDRWGRVVAAFGEAGADRALDLLELVELAWHDCYGERTPSDQVIDDMLIVSGGTLDGLVAAAHLGITDRRDLRVAADERR
jgi:hypothetical protein